MRYLIASILLFTMTQAQSADWTPVFADTLTAQSQKQLLGNQKPVQNFYPKIADMIINQDNWVQKGMRLTANAQKGSYPSIPEPYRRDMQPAVIKKADRCTYEAKVPLKNATLFGKPIQSLNYHIYVCEMVPWDEFIVFKPMNNSAFKQFEKQVKFTQKQVTPEEADCTDQTSYPAGTLSNENGKTTFIYGEPNNDCG